MEELGERIRKVRGKIPRADFAKVLGVSSTSLFNYESGDVVPGVDVIIRICEEGNVNPSWLLFGRGPEYKSDWEKIYLQLAEDISQTILKIANIDVQAKLQTPLVEIIEDLISSSLEKVTGYMTDIDTSVTEKENLKSKIIDAAELFSPQKEQSKSAKKIQTAQGSNIIQVGESVSGGININTVTKRVNVAVQPPKGSIGANALLAERIKGMFNELGLRREERFGKTAYAVMYSEFKKDFEIPRNQKYTAYLLWPESRAEEIINYLEEKLSNTIKGRKIRAASRKGHTLPYLLAETTRLHKLLGWDEQAYRTHLQYLFGVTSRSDLTQSQLTNYIEYLKKLIDEEQ